MSTGTNQPTFSPSEFMTALASEVKSEIGLLNKITEQKIDAHRDLMEQKFTSHEKLSESEAKGLNEKVRDIEQELRNYRDVVQQQMILHEKEIKDAHTRLDISANKLDTIISTQADKAVELEGIQVKISELQRQHIEEATARRVLEHDPLRGFFKENGKKLGGFILAGILLYLLKNTGAVISLLSNLGGN